MFTAEQGGHRNSERQLLWAQDTVHQKNVKTTGDVPS